MNKNVAINEFADAPCQRIILKEETAENSNPQENQKQPMHWPFFAVPFVWLWYAGISYKHYREMHHMSEAPGWISQALTFGWQSAFWVCVGFSIVAFIARYVFKARLKDAIAAVFVLMLYVPMKFFGVLGAAAKKNSKK